MEKIEVIKSHTDILDTISQVVQLKRVGSKYRGLCPFHDEKTPSFYVTPSKQIFKCFGCGKGGDVLTFLQLLNYGEVSKDAFKEVVKSLSNGSEWQTSELYKRPLPTPSVVAPKEPTYMNLATVRQTMQRYDENNFVRFLVSVFGKDETQELIKRFSIGTAKQGATIFWQRDKQGNFRTGQRMIYDAQTGKRIKSISPFLVHIRQSKDFVLVECLFGEFQLSKDKNKPIAIVESEKTAVIMTAIEPRYIWLASCGADRLRAEKCKVLKCRNVVLYPDLGKFDEWTKRANEFSQTLNLDIKVSNLLETYVSELPENERNDHIEKGLDIADFALKFDWYGELKRKQVPPLSKEQMVLNAMIDKQPLVANLIRTLNLVSTTTLQPYSLP